MNCRNKYSYPQNRFYTQAADFFLQSAPLSTQIKRIDYFTRKLENDPVFENGHSVFLSRIVQGMKEKNVDQQTQALSFILLAKSARILKETTPVEKLYKQSLTETVDSIANMAFDTASKFSANLYLQSVAKGYFQGSDLKPVHLHAGM